MYTKPVAYRPTEVVAQWFDQFDRPMEEPRKSVELLSPGAPVPVTWHYPCYECGKTIYRRVCRDMAGKTVHFFHCIRCPDCVVSLRLSPIYRTFSNQVRADNPSFYSTEILAKDFLLEMENLPYEQPR